MTGIDYPDADEGCCPERQARAQHRQEETRRRKTFFAEKPPFNKVFHRKTSFLFLFCCYLVVKDV